MSVEDKQEQIIIVDEDEKTNIDELIQDKEIVIDIKEEEQKNNKTDRKNRKCNFKKIHPVIKLSLIVNGFIGILLAIYLLLRSFDVI